MPMGGRRTNLGDAAKAKAQALIEKITEAKMALAIPNYSDFPKENTLGKSPSARIMTQKCDLKGRERCPGGERRGDVCRGGSVPAVEAGVVRFDLVGKHGRLDKIAEFRRLRYPLERPDHMLHVPRC
jgi:hypothetical protein